MVYHAVNEGDADVVIVEKTLEYAAKGAVEVMADDTYIFILLLHHRKKNMNITMKTKQKIIEGYSR